MVEVLTSYIPGNSAVRTPAGKKGGGLHRVHPVELQRAVINASVERSGIPKEIIPDVIDEIIGTCATQTGKQGNNFSSMSSEKSKLMIPASTVNMLCASGGQGIRFAAGLAASGIDEAVLVAGAENNHLVFHGQDLMPNANALGGLFENLLRTIKKGPKIINDSLPEDYKLYVMGRYADEMAKVLKIPVERLNEYGFLSQMRAIEAQRTGKFDDEIVPIVTPYGVVSKDEGIRPDTTLEALKKLPFKFGKTIPLFGLPFFPFTKLGTKKGFHTAGTSSQISAQAAAMILTNGYIVREFDLKPLAKLKATAVVKTDSQDLVEHLLGPIPAIEKVLKKANLKPQDIDLWEINEAFAAVVLAAVDKFKLDINKVNVNGGAIALGHALGVSGIRVPVTLLHEMERRAQEGLPSKYGLATLCVGGGQGIAMIFERCDDDEFNKIRALPYRTKSFTVH
ncbi:MAG: hypothetical protein A3I68_01430 [Candidatus Melainabacteria bacterium RIFCSPLOWO2_02_FULL_35_15]|nr:MAG: hypothetical protein A3I68_01430 [Candidatus Melainabacteria bacterium RIFCSPLOWO2_02_FULL_35_15]